MIYTSTEPTIFWMLFSSKNQKNVMLLASCSFGGPNTHPLHEILTWWVITENAFRRHLSIFHGEVFFWFLEDSILKIFGSVDDKINPDNILVKVYWPTPFWPQWALRSSSLTLRAANLIACMHDIIDSRAALLKLEFEFWARTFLSPSLCFDDNDDSCNT